MQHDADSIQSRYQMIREKIAAAAAPTLRGADDIRLVAVSKKQPVDKIAALYRLGHRDFGENYVQELLEKADQLERMGYAGIRWHFIGHLQTNKAKALVRRVDFIHSVDSEKVARELAKQWKNVGRPGRLPVFLEVNISREASKTGVDPLKAEALARAVAALPELELQGLMCVPSPAETAERLKARFNELRQLQAGFRTLTAGRLSMGMSHDFELAIAQGATHVRIGTALFGARAY